MRHARATLAEHKAATLRNHKLPREHPPFIDPSVREAGERAAARAAAVKTPGGQSTPGPWRATADGFIVAGEAGIHVASVCTIGMGASVLPNSRMLAAAPELFAELDRAAYALTGAAGNLRMGGYVETADELDALAARAREALRKAAP